MKQIILNAEYQSGPTIMIFAEGTILKPKSWLSLCNHDNYIPIGKAVNIIEKWHQQGANIIYCTSRRKKQAVKLATLLRKLGFTGTSLIAREQKEAYKDIVAILQPDILIEDDCRSIGGAWQMCITKVKPEIKKKIVSIVVPEFKGIDSLSPCVEELRKQYEIIN